MSSWTKLVYCTVSILVLIVVVYSIKTTTKSAKKIADVSINNINELGDNLSDWVIKQYDQEEIMGSVLINYIKENLGDYEIGTSWTYFIRVITAASDNTYVNGEYIPLLKDISSSHYIKPTSYFFGELEKNTNDVILGIRFTYR